MQGYCYYHIWLSLTSTGKKAPSERFELAGRSQWISNPPQYQAMRTRQQMPDRQDRDKDDDLRSTMRVVLTGAGLDTEIEIDAGSRYS